MKKLTLLFLSFCSLSFAAPALDLSIKREMINNLEGIQHLFESRYAPQEWKKEYAGLELEKEFQRAKVLIQNSNSLSTKDYQKLIRSILQTTEDYHVAVSFFSTEKATLPFKVKGINGKYFLVDLKEEHLPSGFGAEIGDELIEFDGRPTDEVVQEIRIQNIGRSQNETNQSLAEINLTSRSASKGDDVFSGPVSVKIKSSKTGKIRGYQLIWDYTPEKITNNCFVQGENKEYPTLFSINGYHLPNHMLLYPFSKEIGFSPKVHDEDDLNDDSETYDPNAIGRKRSFIPALGHKVWEAKHSNTYAAYVFLTPDGRFVGYIRIPHYVAFQNECIEEFGEIIKFMEENTEALVIDQVNNPGGLVFLMYGLATMLTDRPLITPKHRIMLTHQDVAESLFVLEEINQIKTNADVKEAIGDYYFGYPADYQFIQFIRTYSQFVTDEWNEGRRYTNPHFLLGVDHINPHPTINYTKPLLVLVNELDFSGGDFFPAVLQDNKRATIFGTKTAGAGGFIAGQEFFNRFGIMGIRLTASLAERMNHQPIENLGVTPDIHYTLTEHDIKSGYQDYVKALHKALVQIMPEVIEEPIETSSEETFETSSEETFETSSEETFETSNFVCG